MSLFPSQSITDKVQATPYPYAPSVVIAYPSFGDWLRLYNPARLRDFHWSRDMFADMGRDHVKHVTEQLNLILGRATGRAVLAEMQARPAYSVMIFPFDFLPAPNWSVETIAVTRLPFFQAALPASLKGTAICGMTGDGRSACLAATGTGSSADIYFTPRFRRDQATGSADETLLHELVHASRFVRGVWHKIPVNGGYRNSEEFIAATVANVYRSEKGTPLSDYEGRPLDAGSFLDTKLTPTPRLMLALVRSQQPALFARLGGTRTAFNPFRQVDAEATALTTRIEQSRPTG